MTRKNITILELSKKHIDDVVTIHMQAFPESTFTKVGKETVRRYYLWQFEGPHDLIALGAYCDETLVGYLFGGVFRGAMIGFLRKNWKFLIMRVLLRPWLLLNRDVRESILSGGKYFLMNPQKRPVNTLKEAESTLKRNSILAIAVNSDFYRLGIGSKIMDVFEEDSLTRDVDEIYLSVNEKNLKAIKFYESLGWEIVEFQGNGLSMKNRLNETSKQGR